MAATKVTLFLVMVAIGCFMQIDCGEAQFQSLRGCLLRIGNPRALTCSDLQTFRSCLITISLDGGSLISLNLGGLSIGILGGIFGSGQPTCDGITTGTLTNLVLALIDDAVDRLTNDMASNDDKEFCRAQVTDITLNLQFPCPIITAYLQCIALRVGIDLEAITGPQLQETERDIENALAGLRIVCKLSFNDPMTIPPTTMAQITMAPTTMAPTTMAPITMAPITMAPTTMAPITMAPITMAPITMAPTTMAPITMAPITMAPTTMAPITMAPTTMAPTTMEPTTMAPATMAPTTMAPITMAPTPMAPTTMAPTTMAPTTMEPTTMAPATMAPTTMAPTTRAPTTMAPTTMAPTTMAPTTMAPTTMAPITEEPNPTKNPPQFPGCLELLGKICDGKPDGDYPLCFPYCQLGKFITCSNNYTFVRDCAKNTPTYKGYGTGDNYYVPLVYDPTSKQCESSSIFCPRNPGSQINRGK